MSPKVSVIIPFYSKLDWLYEALESVFAQTYDNYEVIVVNDGSKEDMTDFLSSYGNRIIYLYQDNAGPGAARNNGIRHATGDYLAFEDSDDVWLPTKLEKQVAFMQETGAKWCHVGFSYWWPDSGKTKVVYSGRDYDDIRKQRLVSTKIATPAVMIDRSVYQDADFFFATNVRNGEDGALWDMLANHYPLALVQEPLVKVRMRGNNSQSHAIERFNLSAESFKKGLKEGVKYPFGVKVIKTIYVVYAAILGKKYSPGKEFIAKCMWTIPYALERIYIRYIFFASHKNKSFIKEYNMLKYNNLRGGGRRRHQF